jgi:CDP-glycerol glycerophosphotransferase
VGGTKVGQFKRKAKIIAKILYNPITVNMSSESTWIRSKYAKYSKRNIGKNIILYESYFGRSMIDNPYAIFKAFMQRDDFDQYIHVWVLENLDDNQVLIDKFKDYNNVKFIQRMTANYVKYLAVSKYIITNVSLPQFFVKRENQIYVNTWHGIPIKKLGYDMPDAALEITNVARNFLMADYILSANEFLTEIYYDKYKLKGLYDGSIIEEGYPRNDLLLNTDRNFMQKKFAEYGINIEPGKKIIMYAPTWKGQEYSNPDTDVDLLLGFKERLEKNIDLNQYQVLVKPHQVVYKHLKDREELQGLLIPADLDTNEILSTVDILISDYSSIFFDFLVTKRPILFYIPDLEEYTEYRGVYFGPDKLPGPATKELSDIVTWINDIENVTDKYQDKLKKAAQWACPLDDGLVSQRILNIVIDKNKDYNIIKRSMDKEKILIYAGGMKQNGITTSVINLSNNLDYDKYDITIITANIKNKESKEQVLRLNKNARVLPRILTYSSTFTEELRRGITKHFGLKNKLFEWIHPKRIFYREFQRCTGCSKFDYVIDFSGYGSFYTYMLMGAEGAKKLIWQHNDLFADRYRKVKNRRPHDTELKVIFTLYRYFNKIVSCSEATMENNKANLSYPAIQHKFYFARNSINFERVIKGRDKDEKLIFEDRTYIISEGKATEGGEKELKVVKAPLEKNINYVTVGRLSPEKNQEVLIRAFASLVKEYSNCKLYIIGDGPLKDNLVNVVKECDVEDAVVLVGSLSNPFSLMKNCDCFVLPSLYEGQPVTILEARILGLPIIVSKFDSIKSSMIENGQYIVEKDVESVYEGLKAYINNQVPTCNFEYENYNKEVMSEFEALLD